MFLLQTVQAPFIVHVADDKGQPKYEVSVPRYKLRDAIEWGSILLSRWRGTQTEGMSENQVRDFNTMYPAVPLALVDIKRAVSSMEGAEEIIRATFARAKVYESIQNRPKGAKPADFQKFRKRGKDVTTEELLQQVLESVLDGNGSGTLCALARELADVEDRSDVQPPEAAKQTEGGDGEEKDSADPLQPTGKTE